MLGRIGIDICRSKLRAMQPLPPSCKLALRVLGALLFYSFLYTIFFAPVLFSAQLLAPGDGVLYYLPAFYIPYSLWTTLLFSGFPIAADPQIQSWYPLKLLFSYFHAWNSFVISAYVLASFFTYSYVITLTKSSWSALISGTIYGMSGFMIAHLGHTSMIHNALWIPLIVLALEKLRHHLTIHWFAVATLAIACSALAGHPQILAYSLGLSIVYAMTLGWSAVVGRWRYYTLCVAILVLGLSLAAIQLVPSSELAGMGLRQRLTFPEFVSYSLPPYQAISLFFPYLFGGLPMSFYGLPWFGEWNITELSGYIGLLPLIMAFIGLVVYWRDPMALFWSSVGLFAFLLTLGDATPLAKLMYHLPMYNKFRAPARHFIEMALAVSILSGIGMSVCQRQVLEKSLLLKVIGIVGASLLSGLLAVYWFQNDLRGIAFKSGITKLELLPWSNAAIGFPLLIFLVSSILFFYWSRKPRSHFRQILLICMLILDLSSFGMFYEWRYLSPGRDILDLSADAKRYREVLTSSKQRLMPINGGHGTIPVIPPNISIVWGIPSASGYGPLGLKRVTEMLSMTADGIPVGSWMSTSDRSLDVLAVRYVFLSNHNLERQEVLHRNGLTWTVEDLPIILGSGCGTERPTSIKFNLENSLPITGIGIVSALNCSTDILEGEIIANIFLSDSVNSLENKKIYAGKDTSELAYDCEDVFPLKNHSRSSIFDSFPIINCEVHRYLAIIKLEKSMKVKEMGIQWLSSVGTMTIHKMSLLNAASQESYPISSSEISLGDISRWRYVEKIRDIDRWRAIGLVGESLVYENLRAMPRAWLVPHIVSLKPVDILHAIKTSQLPDGRDFDPSKMALVEEEIKFKADYDERSTTNVISVEDELVIVETKSTHPAMLVLSDIYYPGWTVTIDGSDAKILRVNYLLRGVLVPKGEHLLRFEFRPRTFYLGATISVSALVCILIGSAIAVWRGKRPARAA